MENALLPSHKSSDTLFNRSCEWDYDTWFGYVIFCADKWLSRSEDSHMPGFCKDFQPGFSVLVPYLLTSQESKGHLRHRIRLSQHRNTCLR
jgi:hypothetical protein